MQSLAQTTTVAKPPKAFRATLYDEPGTLGKLNDIIYFFGDDGTITDYEPEMAPWVCILGEVGLSETQALMDRLHGGAVAIACQRAQEVL